MLLPGSCIEYWNSRHAGCKLYCGTTRGYEYLQIQFQQNKTGSVVQVFEGQI